MRLIHWLVAASLLAGCASPGMPPGGPPDVEAPRLIGIAPDSGRVSVSPRSVIFRFDEVVSETPPGATSLSGLFVISPQHGTPVVDWEREEIAVRPRRGWRPNTVYSITMLPGLADLRGNVRKEGAATLFSTGPAIPATSIAGVLIDWAAGRPVSAGLVQAIAPDSTIYIGYSDSAGAFALRHLPPGPYTLKGVVDGNRNRALDPRESWDSVMVNLADTTRVELFAFAHDSIGPRIQEVGVEDSVTLRVQFDVPVDARTPLDPGWIQVLSSDSIPQAVAGVLLRESAPRDSAAARPQGPVTMTRAIPYREVLVTMAARLRPGATYTVVANGFPGLLGRVVQSRRTITIPAPPPPPPTPP
ncbi:MAG TPA: Ig-like domain-containing protein [Gemmatimonadaceae bacterium]|nr:Ig-like domain-containing protein [Gemmatimonadaceae bacterium]